MSTTTTTDAAANSAEPGGRRSPDTRDMLIVHRAFRRELRLAPAIVRNVSRSDARRFEAVAVWLEVIPAMLEHHHQNEDALLWPVLRERMPADAELLDTMERQHAEVAACLHEVVELHAQWLAEPSGPARAELADALERAAAVLGEHLDLEEQRILPLAQAHMSVEEWGRLGENGMGEIPKHLMLLVLGSLLEEADPAERELMTSHLPFAARLLWRVRGAAQYRRHMALLRGDLH